MKPRQLKLPHVRMRPPLPPAPKSPAPRPPADYLTPQEQVAIADYAMREALSRYGARAQSNHVVIIEAQVVQQVALARGWKPKPGERRRCRRGGDS